MKTFEHRFGDSPSFLRWFAVAYAKVFGWKVVGKAPEEKKMMGIIAPHTSQWDVFIMYIMAYNMGISANWLAKDNIFIWPLSIFWRKMGAIPVNRRQHTNFVDQVAGLFDQYPSLYLAIAPEGTRAYTDRWKTGFYWIALKAKVKIVLMYIDYERKETGFGPIIEPSGDIEKDFELIKAFYSTITPLYPEKRSAMVINAARPDELPPEGQPEQKAAP
ncbi:MAG: 1-acyl-sn-glycerol-3-phosphate acyltransferase [Candidatus Hydrogenedentes bacterium]|nr:1-acyl-sn-glycerol-3-phosphate acyltransferase [Candidatus Hydrogenedentota bacterium]